MSAKQRAIGVERDSRGRLLHPEFESDVPAFLMNECSEYEKWMLEKMSVLDQKVAWKIAIAMEHDARIIETERKLETIEKVRVVLASRWAAMVWLLGMVVGFFYFLSKAAPMLADWLVKFKTK